MSVTRGVASVAVTLMLAACGSSGPAALPLGQTATVDHTQLSGASPAPRTTLAITVLAVRTGTQAELAAGGFDLDAGQKAKTPIYVDVKYENKGSQAIARSLYVSLEDQDGNLITSVAIIDLGGDAFAPCTDTTKGTLAPGDQFQTCTLFLVGAGRTPTKVSFLPYDPAKETQFVYWSVK
jgi:hypothetical protein